MTMPSSGTLTFTNLKTEWVDTNPVVFSEYYAGGVNVGANAIGLASSGVLKLSEFYNLSNAWIKVFRGATSANEATQDAAIDTSDNIYVVSYSQNNTSFSNGYGLIVKVNPDTGSVAWQKLFNTNSSSYAASYLSVTTDSSGYAYAAGYTPSTGSSITYPVINKYDSSGTLQWHRMLYNSSATGRAGQVNSITTDSSGNIYAAMQFIGGTGNDLDFYTVKYNSSGTLQWQRFLSQSGYTTYNCIPKCVRTDSSANVYVCGSQYFDAATIGGTRAFIAKYNTSGTIQWQYNITTLNTYFQQMAVDSSANVYVTLTDNDTGGSTLLKLNSSGSILWQRTIANMTFGGVSISSTSGLIYVAGSYYDGSKNIGVMIVYNSSGTLQSSRSEGFSTPATLLGTRTLVSSTNVQYLLGTTFGGIYYKKNAVASYLPSNVIIAFNPFGTNFNLQYNLYTPTDSAGGYALSSTSLPEAAGVLSATTVSYNDISGSLTLYSSRSAY